MKWVLSVALLCGSVAPVVAVVLNEKAGMEEVKKKKKGFFSKVFGSK